MLETITALMDQARRAQAEVATWSQDRVDMMVAAVGWHLYREEHAAACAALACQETRLGVYEDKLLKHRKKTLGTLRDLQGVRTVGVIETDTERGLIKIAKPVGVVAAITPLTNPTSTAASNGLAILKTRNAVIFGPHLFARQATGLAIAHMRDALETVGAPVDLVQVLPKPTKGRIRELMAAADLAVVTGSSSLVRAAYSSGTPAHGAGAGNAVVVVDETADLADAAAKIALSKTFDNASSCSSENALVIQQDIWDDCLDALRAVGGHLCSDTERERLGALMWPGGKSLNRKVVAQPVMKIATLAGLDVPDTTRFLMVEGGVIPGDGFASEKLSPVVALWRYGSFAEAIGLVETITRACGYGHSCGLHTTDEPHIMQLGQACHVSRMMVNQAQCYANSGNYDNGMPFSLTLSCGTWGGNITSENICWKHFLNVTWISKPIEPVVPDEDELFGAYWHAHGKE